MKYSNGTSIKIISKPLLGDGVLRTYIIFVSDFIATGSIGNKFDFTLESESDTKKILVSFVRIVQAEKTKDSITSSTVRVITTASNGSAKLSLDGGYYTIGSSLTATANAATGYKFVNWTENGVVVSSNASYAFTVTKAISLVANFSKIPTYTVSLEIQPTKGGTVIGSGTYLSGQTVTLNATASTGYTFVNWTENGNSVSSDSTFSFTVSAARTFVANFSMIPPINTGLSDENDRSIKVYPNPVSKNLTIDFRFHSSTREILIYNSYNQLVYSTITNKEKEVIDVKQLNLKGLAIVKIIEGNRTTVHKVFVE